MLGKREKESDLSGSESTKGVEPFPRFPILHPFRRCLEKLGLL